MASENLREYYENRNITYFFKKTFSTWITRNLKRMKQED